MTRLTPATVSAAAALTAALLTANPAQATVLGAATNDARLASATLSPVTNVVWWGHQRFHRPFFHRRAFFVGRAFAFHRFTDAGGAEAEQQAASRKMAPG
jgi:hypothetical protein